MDVTYFSFSKIKRPPHQREALSSIHSGCSRSVPSINITDMQQEGKGTLSTPCNIQQGEGFLKGGKR